MKNFGIKSDRALDFLVGEVKTTTNKTFDIKDGAKELKDHSKREYNSDGHRSLSLYYEKNGRLRMRQVSTFDRDGNKISYTNHNENDLLDSYGKYELDYDGKIVSKFHNGELEESYEYDDDDNITEVLYPNTGGQDLYEYDDNGLATQQLSLSGENSMFGNLFGGPKKKLTTFVNDRWGNITEMKVYNAETKELLFTQKNTINNQGDEIESVGYKADGSVHAHVKYEYKYDNNGNWTFKKTLTKEGLVYREQERAITYHSDIEEIVPQAKEEFYQDGDNSFKFHKDKKHSGHDPIIQFFSRNRFGSNNPVMTYLSVLATTDRCVILEELYNPNLLDSILSDKLLLAYVTSGKQHLAQKVIENSIRNGEIEINVWGLRDKLDLGLAPTRNRAQRLAIYNDFLSKSQNSVEREFLNLLINFCNKHYE